MPNRHRLFQVLLRNTQRGFMAQWIILHIINMHKKQLSTILFDFNNALSKDHFYTTLKKSHPDAHKKLTQILFGPKACTLTSQWMRGEISYKDIHREISSKVGLHAYTLDKALVASVKKMTINMPMLCFSQKMRAQGVKIAIFTDNMDVFDEIYVPYTGLDKKFDRIFSSNSQKKLKLDNNGKFIFEAISTMQSHPKNTLLIDDFISNGDALKKAGGTFYHYNRYTEGHRDFIKWFSDNFTSFDTK